MPKVQHWFGIQLPCDCSRWAMIETLDSYSFSTFKIESPSVIVSEEDEFNTREKKVTTTNKKKMSNWKRTKRKEIGSNSNHISKTRNISSFTNNSSSNFCCCLSCSCGCSSRIGEEKDKICLRLISHSRLAKSSSSNRNSSYKSKMLTTTIIVLTALATCYGLALSASTNGARSAAPDLIIAAESEEVAGKNEQQRANSAAGRRQQSLGGTPTMPVEPIDEQQPSRHYEPTAAVRQPHRTGTGIKNITAQNGQNVLLHCIVEPSGDQSEVPAVSWFRGTGDLQLLTYERQTIIQDDRFVVRHGLLRDNDWALQIRNLDRSSDSGLYQCQTNSDPPQSQYYQLNVLEPQVHILGAPDMAVKLGTPISLACIISQTSAEQPQFVFWFRDGKTINYELADRGKIVISKSANKPDSFSSNLQIFHSKLADSGNYTCMPSGARPVSIHVHVLEGIDNKRLIMFQNDDQHILSSSAASSFQQSSGATSTTSNSALARSFRTTEGRLYALVIAFSIWNNWFHLLAQNQTGITLLLLAIIGYLIGQVTDKHERQRLRRLSQADDELEPSKAVVILRDSTKLCSPPSRQGKRSANSSPSSNANSKDAADDEDDNEDDDDDNSSAANTSDPLLDRANSALNLLKSLHTRRSSSQSSLSESDCAFDCALSSLDRKKSNTAETQPEESHQLQLNKRRFEFELEARTRRRSRQNKEKPLQSPSSSSASTGYNSDQTTRTSSLLAATATAAADTTATKRHQHRRVPSAECCYAGKWAQNGNQHLYGDQHHFDCSAAAATVAGDGPMIELVSSSGQPTALSLVMDELASGRSSQITCSPLQQDKLRQATEVDYSKMRPTKCCLSSSSSPSSSPSSSAGNSSIRSSSSCDEPHYALPAANTKEHSPPRG